LLQSPYVSKYEAILEFSKGCLKILEIPGGWGGPHRPSGTEIPGGRGVQNKKPSVGGVWIFSGTTQF